MRSDLSASFVFCEWSCAHAQPYMVPTLVDLVVIDEHRIRALPAPGEPEQRLGECWTFCAMHWLAPSVKTRIYPRKELQLACQVKTVHCGLISDRRSSFAKDAEPDRSTSRQRNKCNDATFDQVTFLWILRSEAHAGRSLKNETTMTETTLLPASLDRPGIRQDHRPEAASTPSHVWAIRAKLEALAGKVRWLDRQLC